MGNRAVLIACLALSTSLFSCSPTQWQVEKEVLLEGISPIGIAEADDGNLWISDGDHNRLVLVDEQGKVLEEKSDIERPMHICRVDEKIYVPSYGADKIYVYGLTGKSALNISEKLDAPAAYHKDGSKEAIADFYSHSVLYNTGGAWKRIGGEGQVDGTFRYPTDLQWYGDKLYVADAYNHRVQVFDSSGGHLLTFGEDEDMNATTGIFIKHDEIIVTDFENSRVIFYTLEGKFLYTLNQGFDKPTDISFSKEKLIVTNYRSGKLTILTK